MIGGLVFWEPTTADVKTAAVRGITGRLAGATHPPSAPRSTEGLVATATTDVLASTGDLVMVGDLELTNLGELQDLTGCGPEPDRILCELYAMEGLDFARKLRGGFALAIWLRKQRTLMLAVDHFGIKRLYIVSDGRRTGFAERPSALVGAPGVDGRVDIVGVYNYLNFGCVPSPGSIFVGIRRLAPAHRFIRGPHGESVAAYWDMSYAERSLPSSQTATAAYDLVEAAVARTMRGRPPKELGAFLSGGTDSSTIVGLMSRISGERVNAFSIGFEEGRYNELGYAELAARHFGAAHYTQVVSPAAAFDVLPALVDAYDEPFANNSAIGTLLCAKMARACRVPQLIAGDGGDEIFGGNERYRTDRIFARYHLIPSLLRRSLLEPIVLHMPGSDGGVIARAQRYIRRANLPNPERFYSYEFFFARGGGELLAPDFVSSALKGDGPYHVIQEHYRRAPATISDLNRLMYLDLKVTIGDNDLLKVTRTAELAGVAVRFPMLDLSLVEFTGTWPAPFKLRGLEKRPLFKRAFRTLLPAHTLAKVKHGFGVPTSIWLKTDPSFRDLAHDALLSTRARQRGYFRPDALERLLSWHRTDSTPYYGDILWTVLMLELWHRRHVDGAPA